MRLAIALALVSTGLFSLTSEADEPAILPAPAVEVLSTSAPTPEVLPSPVAKQFVIKCELYAQDAKSETKLVSAPHIVVTDGQEGHIATEAERPFVTAVRPGESGEVKPVVTRIREGTTGKVTVQTLDDEHAHVDVSFSVSNVARTDVLEGSPEGGPATQAPMLKTSAWRVVRTLELGETIEIRDTKSGEEAGRLVAKLTVDSIGADEAAITPIGATEPGAAEVIAQEVFTEVYVVDDLLEDYAKELPTEKLQHTDFVLVMDLILQEAVVEWTDETAMRCYPEKRALVISQTREGHREIKSALQDKRNHVAAAKALLRR
ncbi:type II and III secretion system protein [Aeoliella sp. ICT_H6.2]|uniref:Type II and III secretion system protein n=1 Tax=Aeoliella straminimaris TaxID=2954799 RepID=A0A9X2JKD2_9BACT|nr:type II and III secretion system protein [Aeoliella straminimaris]MCO6048118.1 type II and III secretion system protein [Aeoliella straminimaris]